MNRIEVDAEVERTIERHRRSRSESQNDILRRMLRVAPVAPPPVAARASTVAAPPVAGVRRRGQWAVEIQGQRIPVPNLKSAWRTLLLALDERYPGFLADLADEKGRTRRFVAPSPAGLYAASPHLAKRHAEPLVAGWYFDSNVSTAQVARRARIAARICGLRYGRDLRILDNLSEI